MSNKVVRLEILFLWRLSQTVPRSRLVVVLRMVVPAMRGLCPGGCVWARLWSGACCSSSALAQVPASSGHRHQNTDRYHKATRSTVAERCE